MCLFEKKAGHKHLYHSGMEALAAVPLQTCRYNEQCFLSSSSHICKGLINRLLTLLSQESPHREIKDAINTWSQHHDHLPLQKEIQSA